MAKMMKYLQEFTVFIFIFSIYNDTYLVELYGLGTIKSIIVIFIIFNLLFLHKSVFSKYQRSTMKYFYIFIFSVFVSTLITTILYSRQDLILNLLLLVAVFITFVFFSNYNFEKAIFYSWVSMIYSVIICYMSEPFSQWTFRKTGGTGDPNEFATELLLFLMIGLYMYYKQRKIYILIITLPIFSYGILFAASMSSFIALVLMLFLLFLSGLNKKNIKKNLIILTVVILITLFGIGYIDNIEVVQNVLNRGGDLHTADQRFAAWRAGFKMIGDYILFGVGQSSFSDMAAQYLDTYVEHGLLWSHNIFIQLFSGSGIITFTAFLVFLWSLFITRWKYNYTKNNKFIMIGVVGVMIMSGTLGLLYKKFFWFALALLNSKRNKDLK